MREFSDLTWREARLLISEHVEDPGALLWQGMDEQTRNEYAEDLIAGEYPGGLDEIQRALDEEVLS